MIAPGFTAEDYGDDYDAEVWPENWPAWLEFLNLSTQWRTGPVGFVGLDYNVLHDDLDRMRLTHGEWSQLKEDVRTLELEALSIFRERRQQQQQQHK